jgi:hypothetical protein
MRNISNRQLQTREEVKVAVISASVPASEAQRQQLQTQIAIVLLGLSAIAAFWAI